MIPHSRPSIKKKHLENALNLMISDKLATGDVIYEFERTFASYFGKAYSAVFVTSGTAALSLIFDQLGITSGDEVILSTFLNASPLSVIEQFNATPVLVDIAEDTFNMDMDVVLSKITPKTKAVIVSHMFGTAALIDELAEAKIPVIEDCGHALGSRFKEALLGSFGDYAYFSFAATRMITSGGAGGMILTRKKGVDEIRDVRHYDKKETHKRRYNYFPTDLQAAVGLAEIKFIDHWVKLRTEIAEIYTTSVMQAKCVKSLVHDTEIPNYYRYVVKLTGEMTVPEVIAMFKNHDIEVARPVFKPLHHYLNAPKEEFPVAEEAYLKSVSIPIYPTLIRKDVELIAKLIKRIR